MGFEKWVVSCIGLERRSGGRAQPEGGSRGDVAWFGSRAGPSKMRGRDGHVAGCSLGCWAEELFQSGAGNTTRARANSPRGTLPANLADLNCFLQIPQV